MKPQVFTIRKAASFWLIGQSITGFCHRSWAIELESTVFFAQPSETRWKISGFIAYL